jgi:hypothetical protein
MGLDTSHDCWHGPYSQFMRWRSRLHVIILRDRRDKMGDAAFDAQPWGRAQMYTYEECIKVDGPGWPYVSETDPLDVLMSHSDCEGEIAAEMCGPMADALQDLADRRMPERGIYDDVKPATLRFIAGLRRAAAAGEAVVFG